MSTINSKISKELVRVEKILQKSGLYKSFSYTETTTDKTTYNPITGNFATSRGVNYTFNAVTLETRAGNLDESAYSILMDIIAMPANITFEMRSGLEFVLDGVTWNVANFKLAPQNSLYEITLGRK